MTMWLHLRSGVPNQPLCRTSCSTSSRGNVSLKLKYSIHHDVSTTSNNKRSNYKPSFPKLYVSLVYEVGMPQAAALQRGADVDMTLCGATINFVFGHFDWKVVVVNRKRQITKMNFKMQKYRRYGTCRRLRHPHSSKHLAPKLINQLNTVFKQLCFALRWCR